MGRKRASRTDWAVWAAVVGVSEATIEAAWADLQRRGLVAIEGGQIRVAPLALRRATSDAQRRLAAHLAGYELTENPYIVRRAGTPPGEATILNTRISVAHIAHYFQEGWGVTDIERDLNVLTRPEIEAAIQYYLNHREEIEQALQRSQQLYETHAPQPEPMRV